MGLVRDSWGQLHMEVEVDGLVGEQFAVATGWLLQAWVVVVVRGDVVGESG